jgi:dephospho-CoA kinase
MTAFIGLTGGIGAGKSETLAAFERLGAATLSTDRVTHELLGDPEVRTLLIERWGEAIAPGGEVDRSAVAERVFGDSEELSWLEGVLHPRVGARVLAWRQELEPEVEVAVVEVPLLFEAAMEGAFDATVAVVAADHHRNRRLAERGQPGIEGREGRQLDQEEKAKRADHLIRNDETLEELERDAGRVLAELSEKGSEAE